MEVIWKAKIKPDAVGGVEFEIRVPAHEGARPLCVMKQGDDICVWFEVDPGYPKEDMILYSVATGYGHINPAHSYLGSVIDGGYVWHIYW